MSTGPNEKPPGECFYCGCLNPRGYVFCRACSGPSRAPVAPVSVILARQEPFWYSGFVVWPIRNWQCDSTEFEFYAAEKCVARVELTNELMRSISEDGRIDIMPFIYELALVASGEKRSAVVEIKKGNDIGKARFACFSRLVDDDSETFMGLTLAQLREMALKL